MPAADTGKAIAMRQLQAAIGQLHADIVLVEFWSDVVGGFTRPVPEYDPMASALERFVLPGGGPQGANDDASAHARGGEGDRRRTSGSDAGKRSPRA